MSSSDRGDAFNLKRFLEAQEPVYDQVCSELKDGMKRGHWMWFIFPQIAGLGHSAMAAKFAIGSLEEAREYLRHPVLGARLIECTQLVNRISANGIHEIFGYPDDLKFRSSMTLFSKAAPDNQIFRRVLKKFFGGESDSRTEELLLR